MEFCRWVAGDPEGLATPILAQDARATWESLHKRKSNEPDTTSRLDRRVWIPDGRSLGELTAEIRDFYTIRRREYWTGLGLGRPWHWRTPWATPLRPSEDPPPVPGE
jgi:hypothetical protein